MVVLTVREGIVLTADGSEVISARGERMTSGRFDEGLPVASAELEYLNDVSFGILEQEFDGGFFLIVFEELKSQVATRHLRANFNGDVLWLEHTFLSVSNFQISETVSRNFYRGREAAVVDGFVVLVGISVAGDSRLDLFKAVVEELLYFIVAMRNSDAYLAHVNC